MTVQPILINGEWRDATNPTDTFQAKNPATRKPLDHEYPVSGFDDLQTMLEAAQEAVVALRDVAPEAIAAFLYAYADAIEARKDALVESAHLETGLPADSRLPGELGRTTNQLRQAGDAVTDDFFVTLAQ